MARLGIAGAGSGMGTTAVDVPKNIIDQQEELKNWPDDRLVQELQAPSGAAPQYLIFTEVGRRKDIRGKYQAEMAKQPQMSMAQEAVMSRMQPPMQPPMQPQMPPSPMGPPPGPGGPPMAPPGPPPMPPQMPSPGPPPMPPGGLGAVPGMAGGGPVRGFANGSSDPRMIGGVPYYSSIPHSGGMLGFAPSLTDQTEKDRALARILEVDKLISRGRMLNLPSGTGTNLEALGSERATLNQMLSSPTFNPGGVLAAQQAKRGEAIEAFESDVVSPNRATLSELGLEPSSQGREFAPVSPLGWLSPGELESTAEANLRMGRPQLGEGEHLVPPSEGEWEEGGGSIAEALSEESSGWKPLDIPAKKAAPEPKVPPYHELYNADGTLKSNAQQGILGANLSGVSPPADPAAAAAAAAAIEGDASAEQAVQSEGARDIDRIRKLLEGREGGTDDSWKTAAMLQAASSLLKGRTLSEGLSGAFGGTAGLISESENRDDRRRLENIQNQISLAGLSSKERQAEAERKHGASEGELDRESRRELHDLEAASKSDLLSNELYARSITQSVRNEADMDRLIYQLDIQATADDRQAIAKNLSDLNESLTTKWLSDPSTMMPEDIADIEVRIGKQLQAALTRQMAILGKNRRAVEEPGARGGGVVRRVLGRPY